MGEVLVWRRRKRRRRGEGEGESEKGRKRQRTRMYCALPAIPSANATPKRTTTPTPSPTCTLMLRTNAAAATFSGQSTNTATHPSTACATFLPSRSRTSAPIMCAPRDAVSAAGTPASSLVAAAMSMVKLPYRTWRRSGASAASDMRRVGGPQAKSMGCAVAAASRKPSDQTRQLRQRALRTKESFWKPVPGRRSRATSGA